MIRALFSVIVLCILVLSAGCASDTHKEIELTEFVNYGDTPLSHTLYEGSDQTFHYFGWAHGKSGGKWKISKSKMPFGYEMPLGTGHLFLVEDGAGNVQPYVSEAGQNES